MVKICDKAYDKKELDEFKQFPYKLSDFQKHAIKGIIDGDNVLITASTGSGKCHGINTPILMYNGSIKKVQDVKIGDLVMGDDSTPRNVLSLGRGQSEMYKIHQGDDSYVVNEEHILCLVYTANKITKQKTCQKTNEFIDSVIENPYINISVKDYLLLNNDKKKFIKGYKTKIEFSEVKLDLDPYLLGFWLGDGKICSNLFISELKEYNLLNNKHIPKKFKVNSRVKRLKLLAGLIDGDRGVFYNKKDNEYEITQKNTKLSEDIVFLCKSLGFKTTYNKFPVKKCKEGTYAKIHINGNGLEEIPVLYPGKKAQPKLQIKDALRDGIKVVSLGVGDYYGFTLDNNHKYVLGNFIVTHNTLAAEFAITHFTNLGKRVLYTSPIKALSNQKYYDFRQKFPNISFGILTGDISVNPEAQVVIMTAEILHNQLQNDNLAEDTACVVFDEVHYINDASRGYVWEESLMLLPTDIQLIMLSATIATPEKFAKWIESRPNINSALAAAAAKEVVLATSKARVVPLTHYGFITCGTLKKLTDEKVKKEIDANIDRLQIIKTPENRILMDDLERFNRIAKHFRIQKIHVKRAHVLNKVCNMLNDNGMLPAIVFVFSRKQIVEYAHELTINFNSGKKINVEKECVNIIRRLPNYKEYLFLAEYVELVDLLKKGVAFHHGGMLAILREMVEIMFVRGHIKVLFATETFAVGINLPVKTAIFTQVTKFTDGHVRALFSHEYTQMAGRAGRRGIDTVGNVIHLINLYRFGGDITTTDMRSLMSDKPQTLTSKFKISYNWVLNNYKDINVIHKSMFQTNLNLQLISAQNEIKLLSEELDILSNEEINDVTKYQNLLREKEYSSKKKKILIDAEIKLLIQKSSNLLQIIKKNDKLYYLNEMANNIKFSTQDQINDIVEILKINKFLTKDSSDIITLTPKGIIASKLKKLNPLLFADVLFINFFDNMSIIEIIGLISCFTYYKSKNETKELDICKLPDIKKINDYYHAIELKNQLNTGTDYNIDYSVVNSVMDWCYCNDELECKNVLECLELSIGDFMKIIMEINNIIEELSKITELAGYIELCSKLQTAPNILLKYIMTSQSLYI